jgi:hypothetical protein
MDFSEDSFEDQQNSEGHKPLIQFIEPPLKIFELAEKYESIENIFFCFHQFELSEKKLDECETCKEKSTFISYRCFCPFCTIVNEDMADDLVNEYVLHCFECTRCVCKLAPRDCMGCAFLTCLLTSDFSFLESHVSK